MAAPIDEQVTITASAPPSRANPIMPITRRVVDFVNSPAAIVLRMSRLITHMKHFHTRQMLLGKLSK